MKREVTREKGDRFCTLEIELKEGRLSICGSYGRILRRAAAKKEAIQSWVNFFEDQPEEILAMNKKCGKRFTSALGAAKYVVEVDGEFHGLDVVHDEGARVFVVEGCGQCTDELREWFPECAPYLKWHLNDMKAGCEHQEALGWGHGFDVALSKSNLTEAQRATLQKDADRATAGDRGREVARHLEHLKNHAPDRVRFLTSIGQNNVDASDMLATGEPPKYTRAAQIWKAIMERVNEAAAIKVPARGIQSQMYKDSLGAPCPECGYKYGTAWLKRELPPEVVAWAENFGKVDVKEGAA